MFEFCFSAGEGKFFFLFVFIKRKFHHWKKAKRQHLRLIFGFLGFSPASQSSKRQQIEGSRKVWPLLREDQDLSEEGKKESSLKKGRLCQTHTQKKAPSHRRDKGPSSGHKVLLGPNFLFVGSLKHHTVIIIIVRAVGPGLSLSVWPNWGVFLLAGLTIDRK